ncbi:GNAT family N-acetyltransferase [Mesobacterium pallidum]|uniref:GNAT family N-acetyltransferase n=1 Tax=Mesobacterium pallidum TaxID=2872037 RepID=UPI001EE360CD|nr:GNAT family N-acetyltransferase [Mesobacterium pallidum]
MTLEMTSLPTIAADRFDLRPLRRSDLGMIEFYGADERLARMTRSIPHPLPPGSVEAFITRCLSPDREEEVWVMDGTRDSGTELMGLISLERMEGNQSEIGYWVAPAYWNTGVASEAVRALVEANPLGNRTYFASVFQDNLASAKVLTNCGFEYLGDAETFSVARNANVPTWTYLRKLG